MDALPLRICASNVLGCVDGEEGQQRMCVRLGALTPGLCVSVVSGDRYEDGEVCSDGE